MGGLSKRLNQGNPALATCNATYHGSLQGLGFRFKGSSKWISLVETSMWHPKKLVRAGLNFQNDGISIEVFLKNSFHGGICAQAHGTMHSLSSTQRWKNVE